MIPITIKVERPHEGRKSFEGDDGIGTFLLVSRGDNKKCIPLLIKSVKFEDVAVISEYIRDALEVLYKTP